jgi:protease-4
MSENYANPNQGERTQPKKKHGCLIALIIGVALAMIGTFIVIASILAFAGRYITNQMQTPIYTGSDGFVAVLHVEGAIVSAQSTSILGETGTYNQQFLMETVAALSSNPDNVGIMLFIDTPGGEVYATDELYLQLQLYKEATGRPVYAYCASMAASGGYYIAAGSDKILMNRNCITGSIGVTAGTSIDISGFLEEHGIKTTSIYVGKNKAMGSLYEEFTEEQKAIYLSVLEETYDQFVEVVAVGRDMDVEAVTALADGRIFSPKQALENGLIDGIMGYTDARQLLIEDMSWSQDVQFLDYLPPVETSLSDLFLLFKKNGGTDLETYLSYTDIPFEGLAYYYEGL